MMVVKTIIVACMMKYGYSLKTPENYMLTDRQLVRCVDVVTACYHGKGSAKSDVFECLKAETPRTEGY